MMGLQWCLYVLISTLSLCSLGASLLATEVCPLPSPHPSSISLLPPEPSACLPLPTPAPTAGPVQVEDVPQTQMIQREYKVVPIPLIVPVILIMVTFVGFGVAVYRRRSGVILNFKAPQSSQARNVKDVCTKKKRKRRKKAPKVTEAGATSPTAASPAPASMSSPVSEQGLESECILINEHLCSDLSADGNELLPGSSDTDELSTPELDLETCKSVNFKMQEDTPGVGYVTTSGEGGWTPVGPRRPRRNSRVHNSDSTDQDHFYTTIKSARDVTFQTRQGTPGGKAVLHPVCPGSQLSPLLLLHGLELGPELSCL